LKARPKSASLEPLIDLLAYLWPKFVLKNLVFDKIQNVLEKVQFALSKKILASHNWAADWARELFKPCNDSWRRVV